MLRRSSRAFVPAPDLPANVNIFANKLRFSPNASRACKKASLQTLPSAVTAGPLRRSILTRLSGVRRLTPKTYNKIHSRNINKQVFGLNSSLRLLRTRRRPRSCRPTVSPHRQNTERRRRTVVTGSWRSCGELWGRAKVKVKNFGRQTTQIVCTRSVNSTVQKVFGVT